MLLECLDLQLGLVRLVQELVPSANEIELLIVQEALKACLWSKLVQYAGLSLLGRLVELCQPAGWLALNGIAAWAKIWS